MTDILSTISLYPRKCEALESLGRSPHIDVEYDILQDEVLPDGTRTIVLKKRDMTKRQNMMREIASEAARSMGEGESKVVKDIFIDAIRDFSDARLRSLYAKVVVKKEPVKPRAGCFKFIIGRDGRKKSSCKVDIG